MAQKLLEHGPAAFRSLALLAPMELTALTGRMVIPFFTEPQRRQQKALTETFTSALRQVIYMVQRLAERGLLALRSLDQVGQMEMAC
jgi:hypothetical protein